MLSLHKTYLKTAYGEGTLSHAQVFRQHKMFLEGLGAVEDEPHSAKPVTVQSDENLESSLIDG
ncbi:hypothetical protein WH47_11047 [Habropoda laboriosa]|uniref:Uncharacterized protein n=1 Tax=Habropoda laboriosa TaxID=597456 RepID=A0A0L7QLC9_9HYME|nr:hypothetical protein WH47_11047 [Habropoda laboriosa]